MDDYTLPFWIYLGVLSVLVGGAMKKVLASHLSPAPTLAAWLGATVLVERLWAFCLPAALLLVLLGLACCLYSATRTGPPPATLPAQGKAVFITETHALETSPPLHTHTHTHARLARLTNLRLVCERMSRPHRLQAAHSQTDASDLRHSPSFNQRLTWRQQSCGIYSLWSQSSLRLSSRDMTLETGQGHDVRQRANASAPSPAELSPLHKGTNGTASTAEDQVVGDQPFPCLAAYGASKAALNLFVETLRHELEPWGVRVSTILPSSYKTGQSSNHAYWEQQHKQLLQGLPPALLEDYGEDYVTETKELFQSYASHANPDLTPVVDAIVTALLSPQPQVRYFAGPGVGLMYFIQRFCPFSISNRFLQRLFVKKTLMPRALRKQSSFDLNLSLHHHNNNNNDDDGDEVKVK
ncbi:putative corticosteroid 11-beta-dehydrogenase isozyme 2 [Scophthalmus maximus]|uniref:Putative corticosteroid 11-beta-dehydrogenase isozyme 2 n=1 Tax=Scophthalmus maximus TaxID=52904 RepID=A0A2U9BAV0_SCOMX|nr:putative corticosteroid 11-beta-dehydrogenase isozyme 2 [Scophthalmus maximus]